MNWKSWPYWVVGGIATVFLAATISLLTSDLSLVKGLLLGPVFLLTQVVYILVDFFLSTLDLNIDTLIYPIFIIFYGSIGALLGHLYGKFRNRNLNTGFPPSRG